MTAYYNEHDPFAAAWLRELIRDGLIAHGDVDERDIQQVPADDLKPYTQCHFFAGIGGWSRALRLAGWPDDRPVWTGSCPCQPLSRAGQRKGHADERHIWPAFHALIAERRPAVVFGEQVAGTLGYEWLAGVRADLEGDRYAVGAANLCAASAGAPHIRQRLFWVADAGRGGLLGGNGYDLAREAGRNQGATEERQRIRDDARDGGVSGGLADADGRFAGNGDLQPGRQHGQQPQDGGAGGLDDAARDGRREDGGHVDRSPRCREGARHVAGSGEGVGLGDTNDARPQVGSPGVGGFWSRAEWLQCSDGRSRRVESGIFPLAHGVRNRVGTLRGAGNAIVPQTAQVFIEAYMSLMP